MDYTDIKQVADEALQVVKEADDIVLRAMGHNYHDFNVHSTHNILSLYKRLIHIIYVTNIAKFTNAKEEHDELQVKNVYEIVSAYKTEIEQLKQLMKNHVV